MKKKILIPLAVLVLLIVIALMAYPRIEIQTDSTFIALRYSDDISEFESQLSADESYFYYADKDISISGVDISNFLFFYIIKMEYIEGNYCETQFVLKEEYINAFLERATVEYNSADIDIAELIKGKEAVVGNTRYTGNEYDKQIDFILDGERETFFVFNFDDLVVIQLGFSDEGPRFIAYK